MGNFFLNPELTSYIICIQIPVVLCLFFQSYQAYKLGYAEFRYITIGWAGNLIYLLVIVATEELNINKDLQFILITILDTGYMFLFFVATFRVFKKGLFSKLKKYPQHVYLIVFILAAAIKMIPGSWHIIHRVHLRYVPGTALDMLSIILLAGYFKKIFKRFRKGKLLFAATLIYAGAQFFSITQRDDLDPKEILYLDNFGFGLGLLSKTLILIFLSLSIVNVIQSRSEERKKRMEEEKNKLLHKLNFATSILNVKERYLATKRIKEEEHDVIKSVLVECLGLLNRQLGFFGTFDSKTKLITVAFTSQRYETLQGYTYSVERGLTGKAIRTRQEQVMKTGNDVSEYFRSDVIRHGKHPGNVDKDVKSAVAIPAFLDEEILGVFMIESEIENFFTEQDVNILKALVSQAMTAIANIRLVREIESGKKVLDSLKEIDGYLVRMGQTPELKNVLGFILGKSLKLANAELGNISLKVGPNELIIFESTDPVNVGKLIHIDDSISGLAVLNKEPTYIPDLHEATPEIKRLYKKHLGGTLDIRSELAVPLKVQDEVIGIFNTESTRPNKFSQDDIESVIGFAGQTAIAIYIYRLLEDLSRQRNHLEALTEIDLLILRANQDLPSTLDTILERTIKLINKSHGEIMLFHDAESLIIKKSTITRDEGKLIPMNSICGLAFKKEKTVYLPFVDKDDNTFEAGSGEDIYIPAASERLLYRRTSIGYMKSEIALPLVVKGEVIGVFNLESDHYDDYKREERSILDNLALAAAIAINNAQLIEQLNSKNKALENSINKDRIELAGFLGAMINHRINGAIGTIRISVMEHLLTGNRGQYSREAEAEYKKILRCSESILDARREISQKVSEIIDAVPAVVSFRDIKERVERHDIFNLNDKIRVTIVGLDGLPPVLIDFELLSEIVLELIQNAIKSMPGGGTIVVKGKAEQNRVVVKFIDTGCGIDSKDFDRIFDHSMSRWSNAGGSGIGLYQVRNTLEFYHGAISVASELGAGTTFTVSLPIVKEISNH
jgi:GAF domain-containing protein